MSDPIRELIDAACRTCGVPELSGRIRLTWSGRFTARMGDARWDKVRGAGLIRLSRPLWPKASDEERRETVIHETCHVIADYRFGGKQGHGLAWRQMMALCGYARPKRCHAVDREAILRRRDQRRVEVRGRCGCAEGVILGPMQARRLRAGAEYRCRKCSQRVALP
ncbi:MAG TPA: SprT family zinc-dependent metalloprotease [Gemmataceae bacterium]|nr:SprT family zinc-dependent metalloprotease [Gemmataceae bacterium]